MEHPLAARHSRRTKKRLIEFQRERFPMRRLAATIDEWSEGHDE
jgi:hypothetical protein